MNLYGGIDLHSNNSVIALLDEEDNLVYQQRLPNDLPQVLGALAPFAEAIAGWWWSRPTTGTGWWMG